MEQANDKLEQKLIKFIRKHHKTIRPFETLLLFLFVKYRWKSMLGRTYF